MSQDSFTKMELHYGVLIFIVATISSVLSETDDILSTFKIDGKITVPFQSELDWIPMTRVLVDGGQYLGFVK